MERLNDAARREATSADVSAAVAEVVERYDSYFAHLWREAGTLGQAFLKGAGSDPSFEDAYGLKAGARLRRLGIVGPGGEVLLPIFVEWMRKKT